MSTKIYGGFRVSSAEGIGFLGLQALLNDLSAKLTEVARFETNKHVLRSAIERFDQDSLRKCGFLKESETEGDERDSDEDARDGYITGAILRLLERTAKVEQTHRRDPSIDMGCEVVLFPHESGLYGIAYAENRAIENAFFASEGIERFAYWNNTDRPDDVSEEAWEVRGRLWHELLPGSGVPAECGLSRKLSPVTVMPSVKEIVEFWHHHHNVTPSFADRIRTYAICAVADALVAELPPSNSLAPVARAIRRARDSDEPEIVALRLNFEAQIREALIEDIQPEHLIASSRRVRPSL